MSTKTEAEMRIQRQVDEAVKRDRERSKAIMMLVERKQLTNKQARFHINEGTDINAVVASIESKAKEDGLFSGERQPAMSAGWGRSRQ